MTITEVVCYVAGTRMLTDGGEIAIEKLTVGNLLVTASGAHRPVRWLGSRRVDCARHPEPSAVWPVRIGAGAFIDTHPQNPVYWRESAVAVVTEAHRGSLAAAALAGTPI